MSSRSKFHISSSTVRAGIIILTVLSTIFAAVPASAKGVNFEPQKLEAFVESVRTGDGSVLTGIYVYNVMAFPIVQQPVGSPAFVSYQSGVFTQFAMASQAGSTGLLAHNFLAGKYLSQITNGAEIVLVYGDGRLERYQVTTIRQYQAIDPSNTTSDFRDLNTNTTLTAADLFNFIYGNNGQLVLQTCIEQNGSLNWGRLFIIAQPIVAQSANTFTQK